MKLEQYKEEVKRTLSDLGSDDGNIEHMLFGMMTEVGELVDAWKKYKVYGKPVDWVNFSEEIFDEIWYIVNLCNIKDIDIEEGMERNIAKLRARYPEKFTQEAAINRDTAKERKVLEGKVATGSGQITKWD